MSSFGFGGTNAHVVLEQAPVPEAVAVQPKPVVSTLVIWGKWAERVASTAEVLADWMEAEGAAVPLADVTHTLNHHRARHAKFATVAALDRVQAVAGLRALAAGQSADGVVAPHQGACRPGTVFVYSGQGSQWAGMGRQLFADEPAFAAAVAGLEPVFVEEVGFSLRQVLAGGEALVGIDRIQPVLVGMQLALTALWRFLRRGTGCGDWAFDGGGVCGGGGWGVDSGRGVAGDRDPVAAVGQEAMASLIRTNSAKALDVTSRHSIIDPVLPEFRSALADLAPQPPTIPVFSATGAAPMFATPTTGPSTCAIRCSSVGRWPPPVPTTALSSKSARTRCSQTRSAIPSPRFITTASAPWRATPTTRSPSTPT